MTETIEDKKSQSDANKVLKIHSLIEFLFPDKEIFIDSENDIIKFEIRKK